MTLVSSVNIIDTNNIFLCGGRSLLSVIKPKTVLGLTLEELPHFPVSQFKNKSSATSTSHNFTTSFIFISVRQTLNPFTNIILVTVLHNFNSKRFFQSQIIPPTCILWITAFDCQLKCNPFSGYVFPEAHLFLLYINGLPLNIQDAKLALFDDDIYICLIEKNIDAIQERLNRFVQQFKTWFSYNSLIINTDTTITKLLHSNKTVIQ